MSQFCLLTTVAVAAPKQVSAVQYQQCSTNASCSVGEFLYDDSYTPLPGQSCTLSVQKPDGTSLVSAQAMTGRPDGWYSYDVSVTADEGIYTAAMCCTPADGKICLDKSFEVRAASGSNLSASDIWNYNDRTLTGYGSLVSDIWSYSTRSLTTFGLLASDIWNSSNRSLTSFGSLVSDVWGHSDRTVTNSSSSTSDTQAITRELAEQRVLLEKLANQPIVKTSIHEKTTQDLSNKLDTATTKLTQLSEQTTDAKKTLLSLLSDWTTLTDAKKIESTDMLYKMMNDTSDTSLSNNIQWFQQSWDHPTIGELVTANTTLAQSITTLHENALHHTASGIADVTGALNSLDGFTQILGDVTTEDNTETVSGIIADATQRATTYKELKAVVKQALAEINHLSPTDQRSLVRHTEDAVRADNEYTGIDSVLSGASQNGDKLRNRLLALNEVVSMNEQLIANNAGEQAVGTWLEEGSIIFRATMYNPSAKISQTVPLKFYLPREVKESDIMLKDGDLATAYDPQEEMVAVTGSFTLAPLASSTVSVEVNDVWQLSEQDLARYRSQADELVQSLGKTPLFGQGSALRSEINSTLDSIASTKRENVTPEDKIRHYRDSQLALTRVQANMHDLQSLVADMSASKSLMGYIGGAQVASVWGLALLGILGFVVAGIYLHRMELRSVGNTGVLKPVFTRINLEPSLSTVSFTLPAYATTAAMIVIVAALSGAGVYYTTRSSSQPSVSEIKTPSTTSQTIKQSTIGDGSHVVRVLRSPEKNAPVVMTIQDATRVYVYETREEWTHIGLTGQDESKQYWVDSSEIRDDN